ncbi:MAG: hypothetical protein ABIK15_15565 [Pseudomonadota bacterium]
MSYKIIDMELDKHREAIEVLWKQNLARFFDTRFRWLYEENPAGQARTLLAKHEETESIVGSSTIYPHNIFLNGSKILIGTAVDFIVEKNHRVFGPAMKLQKSNTDFITIRDAEFISVFPNQPSKGPFKRAGYQVLANTGYFQKILKTRKKLNKIFKSKVISYFFSVFLDNALMIYDFFKSIWLSRSYSAVILDESDERFDNLFEQAKKNYTIIGDKSSEYLNWRYAKCEGYPYRFFCLFDKSNSVLKGFVVYYIEDGIVRIVDMLTAKIDRDIDHLLLKFSDEMRRQNVQSITLLFLGNKAFLKRIKSIQFVGKETDRFCMIYCDKDFPKEKKEILFNSNHWYLFDGEVDL